MAPPPVQVALAQKWGKKYGVDPKLLLAIGGHETQWGKAGAGRPSQGGYVLGYGVTDSKTLSKYAGIESQYRYAAYTLSQWGVHGIADVQAGKASRYATDPAWEKGVASVYSGLGGKLPTTPNVPPAAPGVPAPAVPATPAQAAQQAVGQGQGTPSDYRRSAALSSLHGIAMGAKPTDVLSDLVKTMENAPPPTMPTSTANTVVKHPGATTRTPINDGSKIGSVIVSEAAKELGKPYIWGAESESEGGFDCSGLVDYALRKNGYKGPRLTTGTIKNLGHSVMGGIIAPGDLVLTNGGEHVVIYAGKGRVISAPHSGAVVRYQPLSDYKITDIRRPY